VTFTERARRVLARLEDEGLRRSIPENAGLVDFASNDYLGLAAAPELLSAAREAPRVGASGARLLTGAHPEHAALEEELASFVGRERALLFSSGYLAALGALHGLAQVVDVAYSDALNHACVIDGLRLTRLERYVVPHGALARVSVGAEAALFATESLFGMTGEREDLGAILARMRTQDVLLVDEAHALGVFGQGGGGCARAYDDPRIVVLGTLSKAFGCSGGFVAGPAAFIELLISTARGFIFDTSLPPPIVRAARAALRRIVAGDDLRAALAARIAHAEQALRPLDLVTDVHAPIVPILVGDAHRAVAIAQRLRAQGLYVPAIRPPTVPAGTSRLRVTLRADHAEAEIDRLAAALAEAFAGAPV
jgi:8-amino-7-oxononanoate synthase